MPTISSDARFLGVDLHAVTRYLGKALQGIHQWPLFAWLTPSVPVRLLQVDGSQSLWLDGAEATGKLNPNGIQCIALELPDSLVLRRVLTLPAMSAQDIASAVALDVQSVNPFGPGNAVWGYSVKQAAAGVLCLELALASRKQVAQYLDAQNARFGSSPGPEIWVRSADGGQPLVFIGFGEWQRSGQAARWRRLGYGLLLLMAMLCAAIALTPTAQFRLRAIEAVRAYDSVLARAAPAMREREELLQSVEKLSALAEVLNGRIEPLVLMERLTQVLSDDTALQTVKLQGGKVTMTGLTGNSSVLMQVLGEQPGFRDVRAPSPATRIPGALKESFVIEFSLDPQQFGVQSTSAERIAPLPAASAVATSAGEPEAVRSGESSSNADQAKVPVVPPQRGAASSGGGATFGGVPTRPAVPKVAVPASAAAPVKP